jgi:NADP-dependent 3-hydroxy acid dehydrogenase YdfG
MNQKHCAVVTGASSGFGEAIARRLAREGWPLILIARRQDRLRALADELPVPTHLVVLDVRDRAQVETELASVDTDFMPVGVLVNNAGLALGLEPAHAASLDDWDTMIDTNVKGLTYVTRTLLPGMVRRRRGHIVNIGSIAGDWPYPGGNVYGATKAFVKQFSLNLRADLLGSGVRVTNIEPGLAKTEFSQVRFKGDNARADAVYQNTTPLSGKDIAEAVNWVVHLPQHVNINRLEIMPTDQAFGPLAIHRTPEDSP